ncbi:Hsp20/alpha crystallin family protein [Natrialbaceae archaeon A-CW2]|uniref:Hsp20/alpha crystallin family protein n=1 Tax=Natronosalvus amylolyticus TaxID=2961994 RepID=UPI0020C9DFAF|nr:Hsp20 family protein [Natronosalvus amylolyticus]
MNFKSWRETVGGALYRQVGRASSHVQEHRSLPVDILENESSYLVVFDAPGTEPEDLQVRYLDGDVKIRIDRFRSYHDGFEMRFPGRGMALDGDAALPDDAVVDPDAGTAKLTDSGTLQISIPKEGSSEGGEEDSPVPSNEEPHEFQDETPTAESGISDETDSETTVNSDD